MMVGGAFGALASQPVAKNRCVSMPRYLHDTLRVEGEVLASDEYVLEFRVGDHEA